MFLPPNKQKSLHPIGRKLYFVLPPNFISTSRWKPLQVRSIYKNRIILYRCNERTRCSLPCSTARLQDHFQQFLFISLHQTETLYKSIAVYSSFLRLLLSVPYVTLFFLNRQVFFHIFINDFHEKFSNSFF